MNPSRNRTKPRKIQCYAALVRVDDSATFMQLRYPQVLHTGSCISPWRSSGTPLWEVALLEIILGWSILKSLDAACPTVMWSWACLSKTWHGRYLFPSLTHHFTSCSCLHGSSSARETLQTWDHEDRISIWVAFCVPSHPANSHNSECKHWNTGKW